MRKEYLAGRARKKKPVQAGVQAIFTSEKNWKGRTPAAVGASSVGLGAALWGWFIIQGTSSLSLVSLSMLLVMVGVGLCAYALALRKSNQDNDRLRSALYELEVLVEPKNGPIDSGAELDPKGDPDIVRGEPRRISRTLALAMVEAIVLIMVYGGLVQEYASNINMQRWVEANIWPGAYVLNYNALFLVVGGLVGTLTFQLILGKQGSQ